MTIKVAVGSKNPVKINATHSAFEQTFIEHDILCDGCHAPSGVAEQPMGEHETRQGAINRAKYLSKLGGFDYYVGIEGGAFKDDYGVYTCAFIAIFHNNKLSVVRSSALPLPQAVYQRLEQGEELGPVMDNIFNEHNIKQKGGAIGLLTKGNSSREAVYHHTILAALAPFSFEKLFG